MRRVNKTIVAKAVRTAVLLAAGLVAAAAQAEESLQSEAVRVTASRVERELMDVNMSVSVITAEEIRHSNARTVGDLLENVPGVRIMNDGSQGMKRVQIRGEDAFRTVVMIDGQRISEHKSMSGAPILIDPAVIERIEVIKGPASVLYGSDAIGGVVNIITKKGAKKPFSAEVSAGMNSSAAGKSAAATVSGTKDRFEYRLSAAYETADEIETPYGKVSNTGFTAKSGSLLLAYSLTEDTRVGLTADTYDLDFMSGVQSEAYDDFFVDVPKWRRNKAALFVESSNITENLVRLRGDVFYQTSDKDMHNRVYMSTPSVSMKMDNFAENELNQTGVSLQSDWQIGERHYLVAGYEFLYDDLARASTNYDTQVAPVGVPVRVWSRNANESTGAQQMHAAYLSMETALPADVTLNYGVRYTWVRSEVTSAEGASSAMGMGSFPTRPDSPVLGAAVTKDQSDGRPVFNFGVNWRVADDLALRASWAQGFRVPNLMERYIPTSMGGGTVIANPDLDPETSNNYEIGTRWTPANAALDAVLFYSDADNYIESFEVQDGIYQNRNVAGAKTYGLEVSASWRFDIGLEPYASATFMRRKFEQDGISTYDSGTPEIYGRYGVRYNSRIAGAGVRLDAYAVSQAESRQYDFSDGTVAGYGGSTVFNLTAGLSFGPKDAYSLDVGLFNIAYKTNDAIYEPGRYFTVKMNARY